MHVTKVIQVQ